MSLAVVPDRPMWLDIEDAMADAAGFVNLGHAQLVDVMVSALSHRVCSGGGFVSPAHWLTVHAGVSTARANEIARIAEQAHDFPNVMALFRAGKLSLDQTAAAMTADPVADRRVADFAEVATVQQIRKFVRTVAARPEPTAVNNTPDVHWPSDVDHDDVAPSKVDSDSGKGDGESGDGDGESGDGDGESGDGDSGAAEATADDVGHPTKAPEPAVDRQGADRSTPRHSRSSARVSFGFDEWSRFRLNANNLTTDQGMIIDAALNEARDHLFRNGHPNVSWADALVEICRRSLTTAGTQRAERFKTYIHINPPKRGSCRATTTDNACRDRPATVTKPVHEPVATTSADSSTSDAVAPSTVHEPDRRIQQQSRPHGTSTSNDAPIDRTRHHDSRKDGDDVNLTNARVIDASHSGSSADSRTGTGFDDTELQNTELQNADLCGRDCHHDHESSGLRDRTDEVSFDAVLTNGTAIPPSIRDYLTCDTLIQIIWQQGHLPIGVGNTTRTPPNRLRRLLELRDQGCAIPGCTNTLGLQAHHITPWPAGGTTELHNLVLVCDAHHHQHHAGDITISGNPEIPHGQPGALTVTDQHGRTLRTHPTPRPPDPGERPANPGYRHPSGETCDYQYLTWQPPPAA